MRDDDYKNDKQDEFYDNTDTNDSESETTDELRKRELERIKKWIENRRKKMEEEQEKVEEEGDSEKVPGEGTEDKQKIVDKTKNNGRAEKIETKDNISKQEFIDKKEISPQRNSFHKFSDEMATESQKEYKNKSKRNSKEKIIIKEIPLEVQLEIAKEKERIKTFNSGTADFARSKMRLEYLMKYPWIQEDIEEIDMERAKKILNQEHFGMDMLKDEILEYICTLNKLGRASNEVLLLSGPPGTGKTTIARQIAKALGREFVKIPLGGLSDEIFLRGSAYQYSSSKPGAIVDAMFKVGHRRVVILFDEIDKLSSRNGNTDGASALLDALDRDSAFVDRFINIPMEMRDIIFIASANDVSNIPSALYDRLTEIKIPAYSKHDKAEICMKYLLPKAKKEYSLNGKLRVDKEVIQRIAEEDIMNAGIRGIEKKIHKICRIAVRAIEDKKTKGYTMTVGKAMQHGVLQEIKVSLIKEYMVGKVITSAIDISNGRETLVCLESLYTDVSKESEVIGGKSNNYADDLNRIWGYLATNRKDHNISDSSVKYGAFLVNVERLNYYNYDSNYRLAMAFSMYSAFKNVIVPKAHTVIGDVTLLGTVRSNGTTRAHIINALNCGAQVLFIPDEEVEFLNGIKKNEDIQVVGIKHLDQLNEIFQRLKLLNKINQKVMENPEEQATMIRLMEVEEQLKKISKDKNISLLQAFDCYFKVVNDEKKKSAEEALNEMIGLTEVKTAIKGLVSWKNIAKIRSEKGLGSKNVGLHMAFIGNPGTGKTTVAKIMGEMLYKKGLVQNNRFIEVSRDDLVGRYVGHTEEKVKSILKLAKGGVLYIDEAHSLYVDAENDYGKIVISMIVKEMEENRDDLTIILSGYKDEMKQMISSDIGLRGRLNYGIHFDDYNAHELLDIFQLLSHGENFQLENGVDLLLLERFEKELNKRNKKEMTFANGRYVRNIFEKAKIAQAVRLEQGGDIPEQELSLLRNDDILEAFENEKRYQCFGDQERVIGFR